MDKKIDIPPAAKRIKKIYDDLGMSQRKFAESLGLKPNSLAGVISGRNKVTKLLANSVELKYGVSADWILKGKLPKVRETGRARLAYDRMVLAAFDGLTFDMEKLAFLEKGIIFGIYSKAEEKILEYLEADKRHKKYYNNFVDFMELKQDINRRLKLVKRRFNLKHYHHFLFELYLKFYEKRPVTEKDYFIKIDSRTKEAISQKVENIFELIKELDEVSDKFE